jgi:sRNA-binding regulator protein Hfq
MADRKGFPSPPPAEDAAPTARKLIRPSLAEVKDRYPTRSFQRKQAPPEQTNAENYYYLKQMGAKTPMVVLLNDGEEIHGWIEWYDKSCLKLNRDKGPNLLIPKHSIKYMYKENDEEEKAGGKVNVDGNH